MRVTPVRFRFVEKVGSDFQNSYGNKEYYLFDLLRCKTIGSDFLYELARRPTRVSWKAWQVPTVAGGR